MEEYSCCRSLAVRSGSHWKRKVVCCSCIHRRSIGRFRDGTAGSQAVDTLKAGLLRQIEVAVFAGPAVVDRDGPPMRCEHSDAEARSQEEHSLVVEV